MAPGLLAQIIVSKYCDHLPLYRQEAIFGNRHGVHLPRQSMARWMGLAADWLRPIYEKMRTGVMAGGYLQIDETPIRYLAPRPRPDQALLLLDSIISRRRCRLSLGNQSRSRLPQECDRGELPGHPSMRRLRGLRELCEKPRAPNHLGGLLGPTHDATSTRPASKLRSAADGSCARSLISTASRRTCATAGQVQENAPRCA